MQHLLWDDLDTALIHDLREQVLDTCDRLGITSAADLIHRAVDITAGAVGLRHLNQPAEAAIREWLHAIRNHLAAIISGAAIQAGLNPESALMSLPGLPSRVGGKSRRANDDEILLMRHFAARISACSDPTVAVQYLLVEAGARPSEATTVKPLHFDDPRHPVALQLPGDEEARPGPDHSPSPAGPGACSASSSPTSPPTNTPSTRASRTPANTRQADTKQAPQPAPTSTRP